MFLHYFWPVVPIFVMALYFFVSSWQMTTRMTIDTLYDWLFVPLKVCIFQNFFYFTGCDLNTKFFILFLPDDFLLLFWKKNCFICLVFWKIFGLNYNFWQDFWHKIKLWKKFLHLCYCTLLIHYDCKGENFVYGI